jgi:uncharacterized protein YegJ (DUF2314 family)
MSDSQPEKVFLFDNSDPQMQLASANARRDFRYFWRELAWERRRIIPALDLACVKAAFSDGEEGLDAQGNPKVEQMWLGEVDFDGRFIRGELLNSPNWIQSVKQGDEIQLPLDRISDWMYAISGTVYGAYTVNLMRSRMGQEEREGHDGAWGLNFGDPNRERTVPQYQGAQSYEDAKTMEHPMSEAMASSLKEQLKKTPSLVNQKDERGWTLLHHQALAGSLATVRVLLDHGAKVNVITDHRMTPLQLAKSLGWAQVEALLTSKGAT